MVPPRTRGPPQRRRRASSTTHPTPATAQLSTVREGPPAIRPPILDPAPAWHLPQMREFDGAPGQRVGAGGRMANRGRGWGGSRKGAQALPSRIRGSPQRRGRSDANNRPRPRLMRAPFGADRGTTGRGTRHASSCPHHSLMTALLAVLPRFRKSPTCGRTAPMCLVVYSVAPTHWLGGAPQPWRVP